jgi:hypothetical protein
VSRSAAASSLCAGSRFANYSGSAVSAGAFAIGAAAAGDAAFTSAGAFLSGQQGGTAVATLLQPVTVAAAFSASATVVVDAASNNSDGFLVVLHNDLRGANAQAGSFSCLAYTSASAANSAGGVTGCGGTVISPSVAVAVNLFNRCLLLGVGGSFVSSACYTVSESTGAYTLRIHYDGAVNISATLAGPSSLDIVKASWTLNDTVARLVGARTALLAVGAASGFFPTSYTLSGLTFAAANCTAASPTPTASPSRSLSSSRTVSRTRSASPLPSSLPAGGGGGGGGAPAPAPSPAPLQAPAPAACQTPGCVACGAGSYASSPGTCSPCPGVDSTSAFAVFAGAGITLACVVGVGVLLFAVGARAAAAAGTPVRAVAVRTATFAATTFTALQLLVQVSRRSSPSASPFAVSVFGFLNALQFSGVVGTPAACTAASPLLAPAVAMAGGLLLQALWLAGAGAWLARALQRQRAISADAAGAQPYLDLIAGTSAGA